MKNLYHRIKSEPVLLIAGCAAVLSILFVPPSPAYLNYLDFRVLSLLFCLMAVVAGLSKAGIFDVLSYRLMSLAHHARSLTRVLVLLCFFSAMFVTNDVALLTFVPFSMAVITLANLKQHLIWVIVLQTIAANLGSMLTPIGNPQNLYLYSYYNFSMGEFLRITMPLTLCSLLLVLILTQFIPKEPINMNLPSSINTADKHGLFLHLTLFGVCLLTVFDLLPYTVTLAVIVITLLVMDKEIFRRVDFGLLLTFVCFFIFVGNMGQLNSVRNVLSSLIAGRELLASAALSQIISNVPAAVMLSTFTDQGAALVMGVNIGGLGTLVASLASLISFKLYVKSEDAHPARYLLIFTLINVLLLCILLVCTWVLSL